MTRRAERSLLPITDCSKTKKTLVDVPNVSIPSHETHLCGLRPLFHVETWMDLESVIQSEVSQKEKSKYCILMHTCGI